MPHFTFINSAEEDIEESADKQRAKRHLPSEGLNIEDDSEYSGLPAISLLTTMLKQGTYTHTHTHTHIHTQSGSGSAPLHQQLALETAPFSYRTLPC